MSSEIPNGVENEQMQEGACGFGDVGDAAGVPPGTSEYFAEMYIDRDATHYNMKHKNRGMAIIFNHENFDDQQPRREGTNVDCDRLKKVLVTLGFKVTVFYDKKGTELVDTIRSISEMDHSENDCLLITVLSHGDLGLLWAKDTHYKTHVLWEHFTPDMCPTLAGKPKLFFIQSCQGKRYDSGVTLTRTQTDGFSYASYKIPLHADFLIVFANVPDHYAWRHPENGSWFIQSLCDELKNVDKKDILTCLTLVCNKVALDYESDTRVSESHGKKQAPCVISMLTRFLVFGENDCVSDAHGMALRK